MLLNMCRPGHDGPPARHYSGSGPDDADAGGGGGGGSTRGGRGEEAGAPRRWERSSPTPPHRQVLHLSSHTRLIQVLPPRTRGSLIWGFYSF